MHLQSSTLDSVARERILARERAAYAPQPATTAWAGLSWARVSKRVQDTIQVQQATIHKLAKLYGVPVTRERYATGSRWNHKSDDWQALQADIASGQYSHLLLFKADRLAGDDQEMVAVVRLALRRGMKVLDTVVGTIDDNNVGMLGMMSHMEIKNTSVRAIMKLDALPEQGVKVGGIPYGYQPQCALHPCKCGLHGRHLPDPVRSKHVQGLFERYDRGDNLRNCRQWFNDISGLRCTHWTIKRILRNQYYVGIIVGRKMRDSVVLGRYGRPKEEWAVSEHDHPIVDRAMFDRVQARLESYSTVGQNRTTRPAHAMTGLVWCSRCDRRMKYHRATAVSQSWQCPLCNVARGSKKLERKIVELLTAIPFPGEAAARDAASHADSELRAVERQIRDIDKQLDKLTARRRQWANLVGDGEMSRQEYHERITDNDGERAELRQQREALNGQLANQPGYADVASEVLAKLAAMGSWTNALINGKEDERRALYTALLGKVSVEADVNTLTVVYSPALASWCGRASDTVLWQ